MEPASHSVLVPVPVPLAGRRTARAVGPRSTAAVTDTVYLKVPEVTAHEALGALEAELQRIAGDLHDTAAQALAVVRLSLEAAVRSGDEGAAMRVAEALPVVDAAIAEVRQLIVGLRPPLLDELGLIPALRWRLNNLTRGTDLVAELRTGTGLARLAPGTEIACYRIAQEAIANAVRHADARRVTVWVGRTGGSLRLEVSDDGRGMPIHAGGPRDGLPTLGLRAMRERAAALGGTFRITTQPGGGTTVIATLPARAVAVR